MKRNQKLMTAALLIMLISSAIVSGQEKKSEQRIRIVIKDDGGSDMILDTLISGKPLSDSIILRNGKTIYLAHEDSDIAPGADITKKYIVTETDGNGPTKEINRQVTIISSDSDLSDAGRDMKCKHAGCVSSGTGNKVTDSENTRYVISRDGIVVTVEGSNYDKVKDLIKEIETTLDGKTNVK